MSDSEDRSGSTSESSDEGPRVTKRITRGSAQGTTKQSAGPAKTGPRSKNGDRGRKGARSGRSTASSSSSSEEHSSDEGSDSSSSSSDSSGDEDYVASVRVGRPRSSSAPGTAGAPPKPRRGRPRASAAPDTKPPLPPTLLQPIQPERPAVKETPPPDLPPPEKLPGYSVIVTDEAHNTVVVPATAFADLVSAYNILRAFSWQIHLSPFSLQAMVVHLTRRVASPLVDELFVNVLRTLASSENSRDRKKRILDLAMLDNVTWPEYVWEWLELVGAKDLLALRTQRAPHAPPLPATPSADTPPQQQQQGAAKAATDVAAAPAQRAARGEGPGPMATDPPQGGIQQGSVAAQTTDVDMTSPPAGQQGGGTGAAVSVKSEGAPGAGSAAAAQQQPMDVDMASPGAATAAGAGAAEEAGGTGTGAAVKQETGEAKPDSKADAGSDKKPAADTKLSSLRAIWRTRRRQQGHPRGIVCAEHYTLGIEATARILARLADDLLEAPLIRVEIDRRETDGELHAGPGGVGGAFAMRTSEERRKRIEAEKAKAERNASDGGAADGTDGGAALTSPHSQHTGSDSQDHEDQDPKVDRCVLCNQEGDLVCCDTCPASYHATCISEDATALAPHAGEWMCPECRVGGRGEAAGLRVPAWGRQPPRNFDPAYVAYGCLFYQHTYQGGEITGQLGSCKLDPAVVQAAAGMAGEGPVGHLAGAYPRYRLPEDAKDGGITWAQGSEAAAGVQKLGRVPRAREDLPHHASIAGPLPGLPGPSTTAGEGSAPAATLNGERERGSAGPTGLAAGPHSGLAPLAALTPKTEPYVNLYGNSWGRAMTAYQGHLDAEQRRLRRLAGGAAQLALMALPLPMARYQWPVMKATCGRNGVRRCGKCDQCKRPYVRQACLDPIRIAPDSAAAHADAILHVGRLAALQAWAIDAERRLWPFLDGQWAGPDGAAWRRQWAESVRNATDPLVAAARAAAGGAEHADAVQAAGRESVRRLAQCVLEMERAIRRQLHVMHSGWEPCSRHGGAVADIWGLDGARTSSGLAMVPHTAQAALDAARAAAELAAANNKRPMPLRGRKGRFISRAPRRIDVEDGEDGEPAGRRGGRGRKRAADGDGDGDADGGEAGEDDAGDADYVPKDPPPRPRPKSKRRSRASAGAAQRKRAKTVGTEDGEDEASDGGDQATARDATADPTDSAMPSRGGTPLPRNTSPTPMDTDAGPSTAQNNTSGKPTPEPNTNAPSDHAATANGDLGKAPGSAAGAGKGAADAGDQDEDGDKDGDEDAGDESVQNKRSKKGSSKSRRRKAASPETDEATQAAIRDAAKYEIGPREKSSRAAAHAARTKTKGQLSGKLAAMVGTGLTSLASHAARKDPDRSRTKKAFIGAGFRNRLGGLENPHHRTGRERERDGGAASDDDEGGAAGGGGVSSGSDAGDWWGDVMEDMDDELQRQGFRAPVVAGWQWRRPAPQRALGTAYLPRCMARRLARKGGNLLIPQVIRYREGGVPDLLPRLQWISSTEAATTTAALALQVRQLDRAIRWQALTAPQPAQQAPQGRRTGLDIRPRGFAAAAAPNAGIALAARRLMSQGPGGDSAPADAYEYFVVPKGSAVIDILTALTAVDAAAAATIAAQDEAAAAARAAAPADGDAEAAVKAAVAAVPAVTPGPEAYLDRLGEDEPMLCYWTPEWKLPLYVVRGYEERVRMADGSSKACLDTDPNEAANGAGEDGTGPADRDEEVLDQCTACREMYGDEPDKDSLWVLCQICRHWYHAECEGVPSEIADTENPNWACKACAGSRAKRATEKRVRNARGRHPGAIDTTNLFTPILLLGKDGQPDATLVAELEQRQKAQAEAAAAEQAAKTARRKAAAAKGRAKRMRKGRHAAGADHDTGTAAEGGESDGGDSEGGDDDIEEFDGLYCVCNGLYPETPDMVACDGCDQWFHFKCVNTNKAQVESVDKWYCPACTEIEAARQERQALQRKRAMDMATAARARAAALAAQGGSAATQPQTTMSLDLQGGVITSEVAAAAVAAGYDWRRAARGVMTSLLSLDCADVFSEPVDEDDVPDYYDTITHPMDLGTIHDNLDSRTHYKTPQQVVADVDLVWRNCYKYNRPKSAICRQADQCEAKFNLLWTAADIERKVLDAARAGATGAPVAPAGGSAAAAGDGAFSDAEGEALSDALPYDNWAPRARIVLKALMREECAEPFTEPVSLRAYPDYTQYVAKPADLKTISDRLAITVTSNATPASAVSRGGYSPTGVGLRAFLEEVALVWSNCVAYNGADAPITDMARKARRAFARHCTQHGLPSHALPRILGAGGAGAATPLPGLPAAMSPRTAPAADVSTRTAARAGPVQPTGNPDWMKHALEVVKLVIADRECGWPFAKPVKVADAPGYLEVIQRPMDLGTIADRLKRRKFESEEEFLADVEQVWTNCFTYNEEGDDYYNMGVAAQALFARHYGRTAGPQSADRRSGGGSRNVAAALGWPGTRPAAAPMSDPPPARGGRQASRASGAAAGAGGGGGAPGGDKHLQLLQQHLMQQRQKGPAVQHQVQPSAAVQPVSQLARRPSDNMAAALESARATLARRGQANGEPSHGPQVQFQQQRLLTPQQVAHAPPHHLAQFQGGAGGQQAQQPRPAPQLPQLSHHVQQQVQGGPQQQANMAAQLQQQQRLAALQQLQQQQQRPVVQHSAQQPTALQMLQQRTSLPGAQAQPQQPAQQPSAAVQFMQQHQPGGMPGQMRAQAPPHQQPQLPAQQFQQAGPGQYGNNMAALARQQQMAPQMGGMAAAQPQQPAAQAAAPQAPSGAQGWPGWYTGPQQ